MRVYSASNHSRYKEYYKKRAWFKNPLLIVFGVCVIGVAGFVWWSFSQAPTAPSIATDQLDVPVAPSQQTARVTAVSGTLEKQNYDSWVMVNTNEQLSEGTAIRTGDNSRATITLFDNTVIRLDSQTEVTLKTMNSADIYVTLTKGATFHRVNEASTAIYHVSRGVIEMTSLGTGFDVTTAGDKTLVTVTEGRVKVKAFAAVDSETIVNMRTIDQSNRATIDPAAVADAMIDSAPIESGTLMDNNWFAWNKSEDETAGFFLGMFEKSLPLTIIHPTDAELTIDTNVLKIEGTTDPEAEIYIMGQPEKNDKGSFKAEKLLANGSQEVEIIVKKGANKNKKVLIVTAKSSTTDAIVLSGTVKDNTIELMWTDKSDTAANNAYRVVQGTATSPIYPDNTFHRITKGTRTDKWTDLSPGTYFFRVCIFSQEICQAYGNELQLKVEKKQETTPTDTSAASITLTTDLFFQNITAAWSTTGMENPDSFKLVVDTNPNPSFPANSSHSLPGTARSDIWKGLSPGIYHFRVCAFKNNTCAVYSNDATVNLSKEAITANAPISLSASSANGDVTLQWDTTAVAAKGFRAMQASAPNEPRYPGDGHLNIPNSAQRMATWSALIKGKAYTFVICEVTDDGCGTYSNAAVVTIQ